jgi:hypothetical protein
MRRQNIPLQYLLITFYGFLLTYSLVFYLERTIFLDASHQFSHVVNNGHFLINEHRYGCILPQLIPLIGSAWHMPLSILLLLYSLSFNLIHFAVAGLLIFRFRNYFLSVLMALYFSVFVTESFYWMTNEVHLGISYMFLFFGIVQNYNKKNYLFLLHCLLVVPLALLCLFTHPLVLLVFPYLWLFIVLDKNTNPYTFRQVTGLSALWVLACFLKFWLMRHGWYDASKTDWTGNISLAGIKNALLSPAVKYMVMKSVTLNFFTALVLLWGIIAAWRVKAYRHIALTFVFIAGYVLAMGMTFSDVTNFYMESEWLPMMIVSGALFAFYGMPALGSRLSMIAMAALLLYSTVLIGISSKNFTLHKDWVFAQVRVMDRAGINKGYMVANDSLTKKLTMTWGLPIESMLASAAMGHRPCKTLVLDTEESLKKRINVTNTTFVDCFQELPADKLNAFYFPFDTTAAYQPMPVTTD